MTDAAAAFLRLHAQRLRTALRQANPAAINASMETLNRVGLSLSQPYGEQLTQTAVQLEQTAQVFDKSLQRTERQQHIIDASLPLIGTAVNKMITAFSEGITDTASPGQIADRQLTIHASEAICISMQQELSRALR